VINPHIPEYIAKTPWWARDEAGKAMAHHRVAKVEERGHEKLDRWYDRGAKAGPAAKKYRKGACENCGAMTHKKQDCVERPRKKGAKFTNKDIKADEVIQSFDVDYDAKRDRWNGYDPAAYKEIVDEYEAAEAARQRYREEELDKQTSEAAISKVAKAKKDDDSDFGSSDEEEEDEGEKYAESANQVGQALDTKNRITVRNLRLREDTAKYLINLNPESAYYDPKTRSMRDAPEEEVSKEDVSVVFFYGLTFGQDQV
jgi:pre-mRNA-processing factor SLU7